MLRSAYASPESFATFGDLLKYLRRRAELTQRDLAIAVGYSEPQISYLETNRRLPDVATVAARFLPVLELDDAPELGRRLVELAQAARREADPAPGVPPFKGLQYYDEADAARFFGREELTARLVARLEHPVPDRGMAPGAAGPDGPRFLAVVGASGSGKSSVLRAGVAAALSTTGRRVRIITPTAHPMSAFASVAAGADVTIVDQFEELFTLAAEGEERERFVNALLADACTPPADPNPACAPWVLIGLRADFYSECAQFSGLREALAQRQEYIGPMNAAELRRAIEEPARLGGWEFEPGLVDLVMRDTGDEPGALPLLSHALLETWTRRRGRTLTVSGYLASGGVRGAIAETAETVYNDELDPSQQAIARNIFLRLTELGEGTQTARRRASLTELLVRPEDEPRVESVLNRLTNARLITTSETTAEIAHEALIREWPTLRQWLQEDREAILLHRQIASTAQIWDAGGRGTDELYRGVRLGRALEWSAAHPRELNLLEQAFLDASRRLAEAEAAEQEAQRRRELEAAQKLAYAERERAAASARDARRLRRRAYGLGVALALVLMLLGTAFYLGGRARVSAAEAEQNARQAQIEQQVATARELAAASASNLSVDPERSILLALESVQTTATDGTVLPEAKSALHGAVAASRVRRTIHTAAKALTSVAVAPDGSQALLVGLDGTAAVWDLATGRQVRSLGSDNATDYGPSAAYTPDGGHLLLAAGDHTVRLWDLQSGRVALTLAGHDDTVTSVAISADGKTYATASADGTAKLWDAATGKLRLTLSGHKGLVDAIALSADGRRVYTGGDEDGTAIAWDAATGERLYTFSGQSAVTGVEAIAVSPDGKQVATGEFDTTVRVWDDTGKLLHTLFGHSSQVVSVAFSPDGKYLASGSEDGVAKLWDPATGQEVLRLPGHTSGILGVAFTPDGSQLVTASRDGTARAWDVSPNGSREWLTIAGHSKQVFSVQFSPDGTRAVTWGNDGTTKVWDAGSGRLLLTLTHKPDARYSPNAVYSPDGKRLALADANAARIVDASNGAQLLTLPQRASATDWIAFGPDGARLAVGSEDGKVGIYDSGSGALVVKLVGHTDAIQQLAFSPDGTRVGTASSDGTAKLWDAMSGKALLTLKVGVRMNGIAFSPDGTRVATTSNEGTAKLWDASTGKLLLTLAGHSGTAFGVAFSPDGKLLATTSVDRTVKVWTLPAPGQQLTEPLTLLGHTGAVYRAVFSPDGRRLATASRDGTSRVYAVPITDLVTLARQRVTRGLTQDECEKYLHVSQCPAG
jgi:WD40 repeat protein/transcriptional regulator with XRE-family HTH domain